MSMGIFLQSKQNYSFLFSSLGSSRTSASGSANLNFLSDYASIKNGSYGKLMKAYYSMDSNDSVKKIVNSQSASVSADDSKTIAKVQSTTDDLKKSADALLETGSKSLFNKVEVTAKDENGVETTTKEYDKEAIYKAVSKFTEDYNSVLKTADDVNSTSVLSRIASMTNVTSANSRLLAKAGITINSDNTLSVDKDTFMKADMTTVKSIFNENGSYGYRMSSQASWANKAADKEAAKASTYNNNGAYSYNYTAGNIFNNYF